MLQLAPKPVYRFSSQVYELRLATEAEKIEKKIHEELKKLTRAVEQDEKDYYRNAHFAATSASLTKHKSWLEKNWVKYSNVFAYPWDVKPEVICPRLELVEKPRQNDLFRIARLTWSLPYSRGYGRRLDYLLWDDSNGKLMGILGLQSPPISFPARDKEFHIPYDKKIVLVNQTMDAYTLGSLPPYNQLLAGKLLVLAAASQDVRKDYEKRYDGKVTQMEGNILPSSLVAVTTLSAFGKSSIYNRVSRGTDKGKNRWAARSLGPCEGWGTFQFSDQLYQEMKAFYRLLCPNKQLSGFGTGPKIRLQVIKKVLQALRLPDNFGKHNIAREVFIIPHIENLDDVLSGTDQSPIFNDDSFTDLALFWKERYCLPRSTTRSSTEGRHTLPAMLGLTR